MYIRLSSESSIWSRNSYFMLYLVPYNFRSQEYRNSCLLYQEYDYQMLQKSRGFQGFQPRKGRNSLRYHRHPRTVRFYHIIKVLPLIEDLYKSQSVENKPRLYWPLMLISCTNKIKKKNRKLLCYYANIDYWPTHNMPLSQEKSKALIFLVYELGLGRFSWKVVLWRRKFRLLGFIHQSGMLKFNVSSATRGKLGLADVAFFAKRKVMCCLCFPSL